MATLIQKCHILLQRKYFWLAKNAAGYLQDKYILLVTVDVDQLITLAIADHKIQTSRSRTSYLDLQGRKSFSNK